MKYEFMVFDEATLKKFWSKVDRKGPDDCWPWIGYLVGEKGYGKFYAKPIQSAHRFSLVLATGINPSDKHALHSCDYKSCVNPAHLRWGTISENVADAMERNLPYRAKVLKMLKENQVNQVRPCKVISYENLELAIKLKSEGMRTDDISNLIGCKRNNLNRRIKEYQSRGNMHHAEQIAQRQK